MNSMMPKEMPKQQQGLTNVPPQGPTWVVPSLKLCYHCKVRVQKGTTMRWVEVDDNGKQVSILCCEACAAAHGRGEITVKVRYGKR